MSELYLDLHLKQSSDKGLVPQDSVRCHGKCNSQQVWIKARYHAHASSREELQNAVAQGIECLIEDAKAAGLPPVFAAYTALIRAWGQRKQMVNVRQVLTDMKEDGLQPNELHYRAAILAHARNFRPHEAEVFAPHVSLARCLGATHVSAAHSVV